MLTMTYLPLLTVIATTTCVQAAYLPFPDLSYIFNNIGVPDFDDSWSDKRQPAQALTDFFPETSPGGRTDNPWAAGSGGRDYGAIDQPYGDELQYPSNPVFSDEYDDSQGGIRYPIDIPPYDESPKYPVQKRPPPEVPYQSPDVPAYGVNGRRDGRQSGVSSPQYPDYPVPKYPEEKHPEVPYQSPDVPAYGRRDGRQSGVSSPQYPDYPVPKYPEEKHPEVPYQSPDVPAYGRRDGRQSGVSSPQYPDHPVPKYPEEKHPSVDLVPSDVFDDVGNGLHLGGSGSIAGYHPGVNTKPFDPIKNIYDSFGDDVSGHQSAGLPGYQDRPGVPSGPQYPDSQVEKHPEEKRYPVEPVDSDLNDFVGGKLLLRGSDSNTGFLPDLQANDAPKHTYPVDVYNYRESLKCQPEFFFQYDHDFSGPVWQDAKGEVQVQNGRAVFNGRGSIAIPFFACNDLLPRYSMSFVIRPSNVGGTHAVIGNSLYPDKASFLVSVTGSALRLTIRERAADLTPEQLLAGCWDREKRSLDSLPHFGSGFGSSSPNYGNVIALELSIYSGSETLVTITQEDDWIFFGVGNQRIAKRGRLPTLTNEPLYIGAGADPMGHTTLPDYVGTFDSFLFEKCPKSE